MQAERKGDSVAEEDANENTSETRGEGRRGFREDTKTAAVEHKSHCASGKSGGSGGVPGEKRSTEGSSQKKSGGAGRLTEKGWSMESLVTFLAPREKGDIRDVTLVCLSFAVLVYISQRLVCAYYALQFGPF